MLIRLLHIKMSYSINDASSSTRLFLSVVSNYELRTFFPGQLSNVEYFKLFGSSTLHCKASNFVTIFLTLSTLLYCLIMTCKTELVHALNREIFLDLRGVWVAPHGLRHIINQLVVSLHAEKKHEKLVFDSGKEFVTHWRVRTLVLPEKLTKRINS